MNGQDGISRIVRLEEEGLKFGLRQPFLECRQGLIELGLDAFALGGELGQDLDLLFFFLETDEKSDVALQLFLLLLEGLGLFLIVPGLGLGQVGVDRGDFGLFPV
jgi:hypothetical protein